MADFGKLNFSVAFNPTTAFPLDARYYFATLAEAQAAAAAAVEVGSSDGTYFFGEIVCVVADGVASLYIIQPDKTLKPVGTEVLGDGKSIEIKDGKVAVKGSDEATAGQQPRINAAGNAIEWYTPDTSTVSGLADTVAGHTTDIGNLQSGKADKATTLEGYGITDAMTATAISEAIQTAVDALSGKVGTVTEGKTVVEMIQDAQAAATYDDKDIKSRMTTAEGKITTLIGEDASKSARAIAAEEVAKIVDGADSSYDTLKEIADWISGHKTDATAMNSAIIALEGIVDGIGGDGEKATVVAYVTDAIAALKIGDYAKAADLTALAGRVDTLEGTAHEHANKAVLDGITAEKITAWDGKADANHKHDIADLNQAAGYIVLNCGSASVNI